MSTAAAVALLGSSIAGGHHRRFDCACLLSVSECPSSSASLWSLFGVSLWWLVVWLMITSLASMPVLGSLLHIYEY